MRIKSSQRVPRSKPKSKNQIRSRQNARLRRSFPSPWDPVTVGSLNDTTYPFSGVCWKKKKVPSVCHSQFPLPRSPTGVPREPLRLSIFSVIPISYYGYIFFFSRKAVAGFYMVQQVFDEALYPKHTWDPTRFQRQRVNFCMRLNLFEHKNGKTPKTAKTRGTAKMLQAPINRGRSQLRTLTSCKLIYLLFSSDGISHSSPLNTTMPVIINHIQGNYYSINIRHTIQNISLSFNGKFTVRAPTLKKNNWQTYPESPLPHDPSENAHPGMFQMPMKLCGT